MTILFSAAVAFVVACACAIFLTPSVARLAMRLGAIDHPDGRRKNQREPVPRGGGVAVVLAGMLAMTVAQLLYPLPELSSSVWVSHGLLPGLLVLLVVGIVDDVLTLTGIYKLIGQVLAVSVLVAAGSKFESLSFFTWSIPLGDFSIPFTMFFCLGAINAFNLIDGADGLASSIGAIVCLTLGIITGSRGDVLAALVCISLAGALVGFLRYNFPPASVYLGDTGSMLIGLIVAAVAVDSSIKQQAAFALVVPLAICAIPILDAGAALVRRVTTGQSVFAADRGHLHHALLLRGWSVGKTVAFIAALSSLTSAGALASYFSDNDLFALLVSGGVVGMLAVARIFGHAEAALIASHSRSLMRGIVPRRVRGTNAPEAEHAVQLQGTRKWQKVWTALREAAPNYNVAGMTLHVSGSFAFQPNVTLDLGLRYEWHVTPSERDNLFVVFDPGSASLRRVGVHLDEIYRQNHRNVEPRAGVAWDLGGTGQTVLRGAYAWTVDQPSTTAVRDTAANPPFASPVTAAGAIALGDALATTRPTGLAPATVDPAFRNAALQSWNANLQRQLGSSLAVSAGYFGSRGRNLRISRNLNQPANGVRPFAALSTASPILPGTPLGNITQVESSGFSRYNALWLSATSRRARGLQLDASYALSKSLDTNSLNSSGFAVQDSYHIPNQYGLSDFDARHHFLVSAIYELPFTLYGWTRGWQIAAIVQAQSGNPVNIVTSNSTLNGVANTVRPDLVGAIHITGSVDQWFDTSAFMAVDRFGNLGRNVVIGPAYHNTDLSLIKNTALPRNMHLQWRVDVFDLWNHPNFGPPGNLVGSPIFGRITRTRFATGEGGSSRQIQLAAKLSF